MWVYEETLKRNNKPYNSVYNQNKHEMENADKSIQYMPPFGIKNGGFSKRVKNKVKILI